MSYYDGFRPIYTFHLSIEREDRTLLDTTVTAKGEVKDVNIAKKFIQRALNEYTPKIEPAVIPAPEAEPVKAAAKKEPKEAVPPRLEEQSPAPFDGVSLQEGTEEETKQPIVFKPGVKGFVLLRCPECGNRFHFFLKDYQAVISCKCGCKIDLTDPTLARYEYTCSKCSRKLYGWTNEEEPELEDRCQCGEPVKMVWSKKDKRYTDVGKRGGIVQ